MGDSAPGAFVRVAVPLPVHGAFTYSAPTTLPPGTAVVVPFGTRKVSGWVVDAGSAADAPTILPIASVLDDPPAFDGDQLRFYQWIADYYLSPLGEVIATATPSGARTTTRHVFRPTPAGIEALATDPPEGEAATLLRELVARREVTRTGLERHLHGEVTEVAKLLSRLVHQGLAEAGDVQIEGARDLEPWLVLIGDPALAGLTPRHTRAREILARLVDGPCPAAGLPADAIRKLEAAGVVRKELRPRRVTTPLPAQTPPPILNAEQQAAVTAIATQSEGTWLLHGVTGAGKTEVYLALAADAITRGRQVLVLVPEIALTPQLTQRFAARFADRVAVLHSALSGADRLREWRRIRAGEATIAIGARSAIFAPFARLGLIVVDEENDDSYKQEDGVRYHARDLAVVRGRMAHCPVLLGSATPSLESWENARSGRYHLLSIRNRATPRPVPRLRILDMRREPKVDGKEPLIGEEVREAIASALAVGGKAILLYNRRGYATFVECPGCGQAYDCPSCAIAMVYHQKIARLDCHYCGFHRTFQPDCPKCGTTLSILGRGTERIEEAVTALFPGVAVGRMDADTTAGRGAHARILDGFRDGETQLLVGTQIVAKGHDFPDVHVAAVLGVDHILGMPDFRSAERTFSLVTQLCGRAGRGDILGQVFLQTHHPDHPVFATIGDMEAFAAQEDRFRRMLRYPPFARLVLLRCEAVERPAAFGAANQLARDLRQAALSLRGVDVLGPTTAPLPRLVGRWRYQVILRGTEPGAFRRFLTERARRWKVPHGVRLIVDVDPRSLA